MLTATEAEEYRKAKRENGAASPFKQEKSEPKKINQTFNISVVVQKINDKMDIQKMAEEISVLIAEQVQKEEGIYA